MSDLKTIRGMPDLYNESIEKEVSLTFYTSF